ncbi:trypsin-like peptidase domain-containing protein [Scytonema sp. PCC 10023]|uniref:trypsin-like peptidase domain-containing protein n=1 Tax=Scytonema sp. PCC 10023 TaxID=1680591 RepID=UPI0039C71C12
MTHYKIFHKLLGNGVSKYIVWNEKLKKMVQDNMLVGQVEPIEKDDEYIDYVELDSIVRARSSQFENNQLVFGKSDNFLPIAALRTLIAKGLRCSSAVCRLVRDYTTESGLDEIIKIIVLGTRIGLYSREEINNILSIQQGDGDFWFEYDNISENTKPQIFIKLLKENTTFVNKLKDKVGKLPVGTGFLVGKNYLLTNHHILPSRDIVRNFTAQFIYEQDALGSEIPQVEYKLDSQFFITNKKLDYTLVKVAPLSDEDRKNRYNLTFNDAGDNFGWLSMCEEHRLIAPPYNIPRTPKSLEKSELYDIAGEPAIIIQHPRGRQKEIVIFNNRVQKIYQNFIQYETSTLPGSSGSAVLTQNWELVCLHHATLIDDERNRVVGNLGVRINQIIKDLQAQAKTETEFTNELNEFIKRYVVLSNRPIVRGRIFLVANYVDIYANEEARNQVKQLCKKIIAELKQLNQEQKHTFDVIEVPEDLEKEEKVIEEIHKKYEYQVGDIALQIYISERETKAERGATIFYIGNKDERRLHAELLLQSLSNRISELPNQGARSDFGTEKGKIAFCRDLRIPSLRMRLGFLHNPDDWKIITEKSEVIASVITQGLLAWGDSLSPIPVLPKFDT